MKKACIRAAAILAGEKKYEFRRVIFSRRVNIVVIYATAPIRRVVGEFDVLAVISESPRQACFCSETSSRSSMQHVEFIADTINGRDDFLCRQRFGDFFSQILDMGVDRSIISFKVITLDFIEQFIARENPARMGHEDLQQVEFTGGQFHGLLINNHLPRTFVQCDRPIAEPVAFRFQSCSP